MPVEHVAEIVRDLVAKHFDLPRRDVNLDMPITEAPDSLRLTDLVVALEERFGVTLEDSAIAQARLLRDLVAMIEARL
jgi:acyl carrier protein